MPDIQPYGSRAYRIHLGELPCNYRKLLETLESLPDIEEVVPAFQVVLVIFKRPVEKKMAIQISQLLDKTEQQETELPSPRHEISVDYTGEDLPEIAEKTGLSIDEVVLRHSTPLYTVRAMGFAPGFPYLAPLDPLLHIPRRTVPRSRVKAGSVAIGGSHTGIYSITSAGGWLILGETQQKLFDPQAPNSSTAFLLKPGDRVRFNPV